MYKKIYFLLDASDKKKFIFIVILMLFAAIMEVLSIGLIVPFVSLLTDPSFYTNSIFVKKYLPQTLNYSYLGVIQLFLIFFLIIFITKLLFMNYLIYTKNNFLFSFGHKISDKLFKSYITRFYEFHLKNNSSKIINSLQNEITSFSQNVLLSLLEITTEIFIFSGLLLLLIFIDPIGCLVLGSTSLIFILLFRFFTKKNNSYWAFQKQKMDILAIKQIQQGIGGIRDVLIALKEKVFIDLFSKYMKKSSDVGSKNQTLIDVPRYYMEFLALLLFLIFIFVSIKRDVELVKLIPTLSLFTAVAFKLLPAVNRIASSLTRLGYSKFIINTIYSEIQYFNSEGFMLHEKTKHKFEKLPIKECITLQNISFSYPNSEKKILDDITLEIKKGETIGIIGKSGEGKTTFVNLFVGLIKQTNGKLFLDNKEIKFNDRAWKSIIGYIPQNPFMLDDTILNNVTFNLIESEIDFNFFEKCLEEAQLLSFVNSLDEESSTNIGEKGTRLSGGQIQRLSIARALYKNPQILILDEATSSLDIENEEKIIETINAIKKTGKTMIIVSHKPSALKYCDRIFNLKNGKLHKVN